MTRALSWVLLALISLALPGAALAAGNVFTVSNVAVDATSNGAAQARDIAIAQGQRIAYQELLQRLTRHDDWGRLPSADAVQLSNLVLGYEVTQEKSSSTHYIARITYSFKPAAIRSLLRGNGIGYSETRSRPVLVLPVYEQPGQTVLFEDPNPWRAAWARHDLADALVPVILPSNDLEDARTITAAQAITASWDDVAGMAQRYGVSRVVIADAVPQASGAIAIKMHILSASGDSSSQASYAGGDINAAFDQAVEAALSQLSESWKAATIINAGEQSTLVASVPFSSVQEWLTISRKLQQLPTLASFNLLALSTGGAAVELGFAGTPDQLRITLAQVSLTLTQTGDHWQITDSSQAGAPAPNTGVVIGSVADTVPLRRVDLQH